MAGQIYHGRYTAQIEGDFVVFLIGARIPFRHLIRNSWIASSFFQMQRELAKREDSGFLGGENFYRFFPVEAILISYWRSFDHLERFARERDDLHYPAWVRFYKEIGMKGDYGIWHETYMVQAGAYECIYGNMTQFGLAKAREVEHLSLTDMSRARQRSGNDDRPETVADVDARLG